MYFLTDLFEPVSYAESMRSGNFTKMHSMEFIQTTLF